MRLFTAWFLSVFLFVSSAVRAEPEVAPPRAGDEEAVSTWVAAHLDELTALYRHLHANPELSLEEEATAARVAVELQAAGYAVTGGVGGHGVVAVLENGAGPTVLLRGDMDALPVEEATGLPYASTVRAARADGSETGVMHACGHDVHASWTIGAAHLLANEPAAGDVLVVLQPAEEVGRGAPAVLKSGVLDDTSMIFGAHVDRRLDARDPGIDSG